MSETFIKTEMKEKNDIVPHLIFFAYHIFHAQLSSDILAQHIKSSLLDENFNSDERKYSYQSEKPLKVVSFLYKRWIESLTLNKIEKA